MSLLWSNEEQNTLRHFKQFFFLIQCKPFQERTGSLFAFTVQSLQHAVSVDPLDVVPAWTILTNLLLYYPLINPLYCISQARVCPASLLTSNQDLALSFTSRCQVDLLLTFCHSDEALLSSEQTQPGHFLTFTIWSIPACLYEKRYASIMHVIGFSIMISYVIGYIKRKRRQTTLGSNARKYI